MSKLTSKRLFKGDPVSLELKDNAELGAGATVARKTPLRYKDHAGKILDNLLEAGLIVPEDGPVRHISPGFFVSKKGTDVPRLVGGVQLSRDPYIPIRPPMMSGRKCLSIPSGLSLAT